jgi:primosomal replication protein N
LNTLVIDGVVVALQPIRHTPAGIPLLSFVLQHASEVMEAGFKRKIECEVNAVTLGELAKISIQIGDKVKAKGFLNKRSAKSTQLVLHIIELKTI